MINNKNENLQNKWDKHCKWFVNSFKGFSFLPVPVRCWVSHWRCRLVSSCPRVGASESRPLSYFPCPWLPSSWLECLSSAFQSWSDTWVPSWSNPSPRPSWQATRRSPRRGSCSIQPWICFSSKVWQGVTRCNKVWQGVLVINKRWRI